MRNAFKAYDVRGVFNEELFPEDAVRIGACCADLIRQKACIGGDVRLSTPAIKHAFISGFLSAGFDIVDIGVAPTPVINYYGLNHKLDNVTITGSHTAPDVNGLKFFDKLGVIYDKRLRKIEEKYLNKDFSRADLHNLGALSYDNNALSEYADNIVKRIKLARKVKVVLDHGNGASCLIAAKVMESLGCEVVNVSAEPDGKFPNRDSEPRKDNLVYLQKRIIESKADFGCAFDGDADRSVFIDDKGVVLDGGIMSTFFAREILKNNKNAYIVASVDTSSALKKIVEDCGGSLVWCAVGMKNVEHGLLENKAMFGGEVSSHFYFNDFYPFSDGILSCAKLAQILSMNSAKFSDLVDSLPKFPIKHAKFNVKNHSVK
ncbi:hypothetical protein COZ55_02350, partial [archaeon CG_4_8_14_3_um_filter_38_5]